MTVNLCVVSGTLVAPDGSPMSEAQVQFLPAPVTLRGKGTDTLAPRPVQATTDGAATLNVGLAPGVYTLRTREAEGREYPPCLVDVPAAEAAALSEILLHLPAPQSVYDAAASARTAALAAGQAGQSATEATAAAAATTAEVLLTGMRSYASLDEAATASLPDATTRLQVLHAGRSIAYRHDPQGTALTTLDGRTWSPAGEATVLHWGAGPEAPAAINRAAFLAAMSFTSTVHVPNVGEYAMGSEPLVINSGVALLGERRGGGTRLRFSGGTGIRIAPTDPESTNRVTGVRLERLSLFGPGASGAPGYALEAIQTGSLQVRDLYFQDFHRGILHRGGQSAVYSGVRGFGVTNGALTEVSGNVLFHVTPHQRTSGSTIPCYVLTLNNFEFGGNATHLNVEDVLRVDGVDGFYVSDGYVNGGRSSLIHFSSLEEGAQGSSVAVLVKNVHADCMINAGATPVGMKFSRDANPSGGAVIDGAYFANCKFGRAEVAALQAPANTGIMRSVHFTGCEFRAGNAGRAIDIRGSSALNGSCVFFHNCKFDRGIGSIIDSGRVVSLTGGIFRRVTGGPALTLDGAIANAIMQGVAFDDNADGDFADNATIAARHFSENAGDLSAAGDRGVFTPIVRFGNTPTNGTFSRCTGDYVVSKGMVFFRIAVTFTNTGTVTGELRVDFPENNDKGQPMPTRVPIGDSTRNGIVTCRLNQLTADYADTGDGLIADFLTTGAIRISRLNSFGQQSPVSHEALRSNASIEMNGFWFTG